jgi:hypothetical protein
VREGGTVSKAVVVRVLKARAVGCGYSVFVDAPFVILTRKGVPEAYPLPELVPRRLLQRLSKKYGVPIDAFYHPPRAPGTQ